MLNALVILHQALAAAEPPSGAEAVRAVRMFKAIRAELVRRKTITVQHPRLARPVEIALAKPRFMRGDVADIGMLRLRTRIGIREIVASVAADDQTPTELYFQIKGRKHLFLGEVHVDTSTPREFLASIVRWLVVSVMGPEKAQAAAEPQAATGRMSLSFRGRDRKRRAQAMQKALAGIGVIATVKDISDYERWVNLRMPVRADLFNQVLTLLRRHSTTEKPIELYTGRSVYSLEQLPANARLIWDSFQSTLNERQPGQAQAATEPPAAGNVITAFRELLRRLPETTPDLYPREHKRIRFQGLDVVALNHDGDNTIRIHVLADDRDICGFAEIPYSPKLPPAVRVELQGPRGVAYHRITSARDYRDLLRQILAWVTVQYRRSREQSQHIHFPETR